MQWLDTNPRWQTYKNRYDVNIAQCGTLQRSLIHKQVDSLAACTEITIATIANADSTSSESYFSNNKISQQRHLSHSMFTTQHCKHPTEHARRNSNDNTISYHSAVGGLAYMPTIMSTVDLTLPHSLTQQIQIWLPCPAAVMVIIAVASWPQMVNL